VDAGEYIESVSPAEQRQLDQLMAKNNDGRLSQLERQELVKLVDRLQRLALKNAMKREGLMGARRHCEIKQHPPHAQGRCPVCLAGERRIATLLHWLTHWWEVKRDTGKTVYEECVVCGARRAWQRWPGVGAQPVDRAWVDNEPR